MADAARSVFGSVDQDAVLANLGAATDDGVDSTFFAEAITESREVPGLAEATPEQRRAFILHGPAGLEIA